MIRTFIAAVLLAVALAQPVGAHDFDKGLAAYHRGDFATALREWKPLAEQGSAAAVIIGAKVCHCSGGICPAVSV